MSNIQIKVVAFGIARDIIGANACALELPVNTSVKEAMIQLTEQYPGFNKLASLRLAVNEEYVDSDYIIGAEDELVLIPPVSGG
ncbi:MAG: MoaD/ThiS family protein [Reichenbachiella sp.]|uniref:MoaD/ThiS family protein n=1 Tax=Reichenbachiella sp. TaxID=2184521 RepID=UPI0032632724